MADNEELDKLGASLDTIKDSFAGVTESISNSLMKSLVSANINAQELVQNFGKGKDITVSLEKELKNADIQSTILGLNRIKLESELKKLEGVRMTKKSTKLKEDLTNQILENKLVQEINDEHFETLSQLEKINNENKKINDKQTKSTSLSEALNTALEKTLGTEISSVKEMTTVAGLFGLLISAALNADKQTTELAKSLTLTKEEASGVREEFVSFSREITDASITTNRLIESFGKLSKLVGFNIPLSKSLLKEFTTLTKNIGISEESAGGLGKLTLATGKDARQVTTQALGTAQALQSQYGIQLDNREVLEDIGKVSGQLLANFQANPSAIAAAVTQAKLLGINLETVKKQGESLLNFESSIENELKAELLTGQQLNLEKARSAALSGDQVTLMKELNNQNIDFNKFSKMNVLAQKSLAEALGLSADELSDQLFKQQMMHKSKAEVIALGGEEAAQRLEQLSAQDKFNNAVEKLQDIFGNLVAGPLGSMLNIITSILSNTISLSAIMGGVMILNVMKMITLMREAKKISMGAAIIEIIKASFQSVGGLPGIGLIAAGAMAGIGIAYLNSQSSMSDGIIGPGGETVLSGPKGSIKLNENDSLIAGTNLFNKGKETISPSIKLNENDSLIAGTNLFNKGKETISPSIDLSPMITAINEVRSAVDRLYNKNTTINMDGKRVGTTLIQSSYKVA